MAVFYLDVRIIGRRPREEHVPRGHRSSKSPHPQGRSVVAAAAYRAGERLHDERREKSQDYSRTKRVKHSEIMLPVGAPARFSDRETLWNEVEKAEKRRDSQLARELVVALPHELSETQNRELVREFSKGFVDQGMCADIAIHEPSPKGRDERNVHAHILLTKRAVNAQGFGLKIKEWDDRQRVKEWRSKWAKMTNLAMERAGHSERIDHRSLAEQRASAIKSRDASRFQVAALGPRNLPVTGAAYYMHHRGEPSARWDWIEKAHGPIRESLSNRDRQIVQMISQAPKRGEMGDEKRERQEFSPLAVREQLRTKLEAEREAAEKAARKREKDRPASKREERPDATAERKKERKRPNRERKRQQQRGGGHGLGM